MDIVRLVTKKTLCCNCGHVYGAHYFVPGPRTCPAGDCECTKAALAQPEIRPTHHVASYDGKLVPIDYVNDRKREYSIAAMRICDNGFDGYVITPKGEVFEVLRSRRASRKLTGDERDDVLIRLGVAA